jgi:hypothetical protein
MNDKKKEIVLSTIAANVYHITGCPDYSWDALVILNIEQRVKAYLNAICNKAIKNKNKKKKKKLKKDQQQNTFNNLKPNDIYTALRGTPEYYGTKYSILWKKLKKKLAAEQDDPMEVIDEDIDAHETVDVLENALGKLNDNSKEYKQFIKEKETIIRHADKLTLPMTLEEYQQYHKKPKIKFTKELLRYWLDWDKISIDLSTIFAWLITYKIRKIVAKAKVKHANSVNSLFTNEDCELDYQRKKMLDVIHFVDQINSDNNNNNYNNNKRTITTNLLQLDLQNLFMECDEYYMSDKSNKQTDFALFDAIDTIRQSKFELN